ncbi:signal peptidase I [Campylobacter sputorum]|uniref:signal peptidase I n=1 Tax=Campylobacter sputorum TaxID=206 RepID=UPI000B7774CA|nr:signal peptidase I [Campylobacter sputorum]ASM36437.1 leader peptidase (signal peptidase I) [Campylobacter sputorum bv. faecalis CCUG 20703]
MKRFFSKAYNFSSSWTGTIIIVLLIIFFIAQAFVIPSGSMKNTLLIGDHLFVKKYSYGIPTPHIPWIELPVLPDFDGDGHIISGDKPKRGDIVVFRFPEDEKIHYVKRNFATGDDEVIFDGKAFYLRANEGDEYMKKTFKGREFVTLNDKLFVKEPYDKKGIHYTDRKDLFLTMLAVMQKGDKVAMMPTFVKELPKRDNFYNANVNAFYFKVPTGEFFMIGDNRDNSYDSRFWGSVPYKFIVGKPWFIYFSWDSEYKIRWERIGRFIDTVENDTRYIYDQP